MSFNARIISSKSTLPRPTERKSQLRSRVAEICMPTKYTRAFGVGRQVSVFHVDVIDPIAKFADKADIIHIFDRPDGWGRS